MTARRAIGDYELLAELRSGGMGEVYVGRRRGAHGFKKLVAIKTMLSQHADLDAHRSAFLDEAKLLARLEHPAIAQVHDFGEDDGLLYLVMEYVAGVTLARLTELAEGPLPPRTGVEIIAQACRGLASAHGVTDPSGRPLGVVHRDVSPQNILVSFQGAAKVIDFGIAFALEREQPVTEYGKVKGKPRYMAPEQWKNEAIDHRVDVFAAGIVLHEILTGQRLFLGDSAYATGMAVCTQPVPLPSTIRPEVPSALDAVVMKALERTVERRYSNMDEMAADLEAVAPELPGEGLHVCAQRLLAEAAEEHRAFIHRDVDGPIQAVGRPPEVATAVATGAPERPAASDKPRFRLERLGLLLILALIAVLAGLGYLQTQPTAPEASVTMAPPPSVAPPAAKTAPVKDERPPVDTKVVAKKRAAPPRRVAAKKKPAAPPPPAVAKPSEPAELTIFAEPYATIRLDGELRGNTPKYRLRTTAGPHVLELIHPADGSVRLRSELNLEPGERRRVRAPAIE